MSWIPQALSYGYTAVEIVKWLTKHDKKNAPVIEKALSSGYSAEEIINYISGKGVAPAKTKSNPEQQQGTTRQKTYASLESQKALPDVLLNKAATSAPSLIAGGIAAKSLAPLASSVFDQVGDYISSKINQPSTAPVPENDVKSNIETGASIVKPNEPEDIFTPFEVEGLKKTKLSDIAKFVGEKFGFKNKPLVNAVSAVLGATGMTVEGLYQKIKDQDVSTPEKAKAAVEQIKDENQFINEKDIKPSEKSKDALQSDLKSSVIRYTNYNDEDQVAKVVFNNGHTYIYKNVPIESYKKMIAGQTPAKTSGENQWGMWWVGKNPSLGAAFNKHIKAPGFEYKRIGDTPFEEEEYLKEAQEAKKALKGYISEERKTKTASSSIRTKKVKNEDLSKQIKDRKIDLMNDVENIKDKKGPERKEAIKEHVIDRLQIIKDEMALHKGKKKSKGETKSLRGKDAIKKLLPLLPKDAIIQVRKKYDTLDEKQTLELILQLLK